MIQLRIPDLASLPAYLEALQTGWTAGSDHDVETAGQIIANAESDPQRFVSSLWNPAGQGRAITLDDGREVPRLAHVRYWLFDGGYCGDLNLRWQPGSSELPEYCDGHVGYAVVPWKRRQGIATAALRGLTEVAPQAFGLAWLDIATSEDNIASRKVAESAGASFVKQYIAVEQGGIKAMKYRLWCDEV